jgi:hypothetical protein
VGYQTIRRLRMPQHSILHGYLRDQHQCMKIQHNIRNKLYNFDRYKRRNSDLLNRYKNYSYNQHNRRNYSSCRLMPRRVYMRLHRQLCERPRCYMQPMNLDSDVLPQ